MKDCTAIKDCYEDLGYLLRNLEKNVLIVFIMQIVFRMKTNVVTVFISVITNGIKTMIPILI